MNNPLQAFFIKTIGPMSETGHVCDMGRPPLHLVPTTTVKGDGDDLKENLVLGREEFGSIRPPPPPLPCLKDSVFSCCAGSVPITLKSHSSQCCSVTILTLPVYISASI